MQPSEFPPLADDALVSSDPASAVAQGDSSVDAGAAPAEATVVAPVAATTAAPVVAPAHAETAPADCALRLKQLFPALFVGAPKPLKLRIQVDIQERAPVTFTKQALSAFFRRYTGSTSYLQAVANGRQRFDLDGQPCGEIADEHRQAARDELVRRRANHEERRALEDQQRRNRAGLLHDYERTTLTRANFCALKQVAEEELDGLLAIARDEAAQHHGAAQRGPEQRGLGQRPAKSRT